MKYYFSNTNKDEYSVEKITERVIQDIDTDLEIYKYNDWTDSNTNKEQFKQYNNVLDNDLFSTFKASNSKKGTFYDLQYVAKINKVPIYFSTYDNYKTDSFDIYCFGYTSIYENTEIKTCCNNKVINEGGCDEEYPINYQNCGVNLFSYIEIDDSLPLVDYTNLKDNLYSIFEDRLYACTWIKDIDVPLIGKDEYNYKLDSIVNKYTKKITTTDIANRLIIEDNNEKCEYLAKIYENNPIQIGTETSRAVAKFEWKRSIGRDYFEYYIDKENDQNIQLIEDNIVKLSENKKIDEFKESTKILPKSNYDYPVNINYGINRIQNNNKDTLFNLLVENNTVDLIENNEIHILINQYLDDNLSGELHRKISLKLTEEDNTHHLTLIENGAYDELRGIKLYSPKIQLNGGYLDYTANLENQVISLKTLLWDNFEFTEGLNYIYTTDNLPIVENNDIKISDENYYYTDINYNISKKLNETYINVAFENSNNKLLENDSQIIRDYESTKPTFEIKRALTEEYNDEADENKNWILSYPLKDIATNIAVENTKNKLLENDNQVIHNYYDEDFDYSGKKNLTLVAYEGNPIKVYNSIYDPHYNITVQPILAENIKGISYSFGKESTDIRYLPKDKWDLKEVYYKTIGDGFIYENNTEKIIEQEDDYTKNYINNKITDYFSVNLFENNDIKLYENSGLIIHSPIMNKYKEIIKTNFKDEYNLEVDTKDIFNYKNTNNDYFYSSINKNNKEVILEKSNNYIVDNEYKEDFNYEGNIYRKEFLIEDNKTKIINTGLYRNRVAYDFKISDRNKYKIQFTENSEDVVYLGRTFNEWQNEKYIDVILDNGKKLLENTDIKLFKETNTEKYNESLKTNFKEILVDLIEENSTTKLLENVNKRIFYNNINENNYFLVRKDNANSDIRYYDNGFKTIPKGTYNWVKLRVYDTHTDVVPYIPYKDNYISNYDFNINEENKETLVTSYKDSYDYGNKDHLVFGFKRNLGIDYNGLLTNSNVKIVENTNYKLHEDYNEDFELHYKEIRKPYIMDGTKNKCYEGIKINSALNTLILTNEGYSLKNLFWDRLYDDYTNQFIKSDLILEDTKNKSVEINSKDTLLNKIKVTFKDKSFYTTVDNIPLKENNDIYIDSYLKSKFSEGNLSKEDYKYEIDENSKNEILNNNKDIVFLLTNSNIQLLENNNIKIIPALNNYNEFIIDKTFNMKVGFIDGTLLNNGVYNRTIGIANLYLLEDTETQTIEKIA